MQRKYPEEYKKDIVRLYHKRAEGMPRVKFADIHGVSDTTVRNWCKKYPDVGAEKENEDT